MDGGGVPPGLDLAQANWFYQNVFLPPAHVAPEWNGDVASGDAGTLGPDYLAAITARINAYRWMAGLPGGVTLDPTENAEDQQDALMTAANQQLSHDPPSTWVDYTAAGANAASHSNIAIGASGTSAIDLFMTDPGDNNTIVGHRRWILYPPTQTMGVGDIPGESDSLWVIQPQATPVPDVSTIAWPPAGFVPDSLLPDRWSLQAQYGSDFSNATVAVTENGVPQQIDILSNSGLDYGGQAIVWDMPDAAAPQPGQQVVYHVQIDNAVINGQTQSFSYTTTAFDPTATTDLTPVPAQIGFLQSSAVVNWTDGTLSINVARSVNSDQQVSVDYATANGTALSGTNYASTSGVLTFAPGQFYQQIVVPILLGSSANPGGTFSITLSSPTNATIGPISQTQVTISTTAPPIEFDAPKLEPNDDSGTPGDGITDDSTPAFFGSVDPEDTVLLVNGTHVIGTTTSDANGNYVVSVQKALNPGTYGLSVFASDATGATAASYPLYLTIVAAPPAPSAPTLWPADSNGSPGGETTDLTSPFLTGRTIAGATVQLLNTGGAILNTSQANSAGGYQVQIPGPLGVGSHAYRVQIIDQYGDTSNPSAAETITVVSPHAPPPPPLVTVKSAFEQTNKKHQVTEVLVIFSGAVNATGADRTGTYHLATAGDGGSYTAKSAGVINLKSASYNPTDDTVTLTPAKPFALTKPVQVVVYTSGPNGLQDTHRRFINGGKNLVVFPTPGLVMRIEQSAGTDTRTLPTPAAIDSLLERDDLAVLFGAPLQPMYIARSLDSA